MELELDESCGGAVRMNSPMPPSGRRIFLGGEGGCNESWIFWRKESKRWAGDWGGSGWGRRQEFNGLKDIGRRRRRRESHNFGCGKTFL